MLETVQEFIERHRLLPGEGTVVVAVSGGVDSLCLLHVLQRLCGPEQRFPGVRLHVAHLDHQLRGEASAADAEHVATLVHSWGLPITVGSEDVVALARAEGRSLEEAAREARYRFLRAVLREVAGDQPGSAIAVGHHRDDQFETLLLHLLRGGGLASMPGLQPRQQEIIRPLLGVTRADTARYCEREGIMPLEDQSNTDARFLRNRIRHELVPLLTSLNAGIRETMIRNAEGMQVDLAWLEAQVDMVQADVVRREEKNRVELAVPALRALPLSLQRHLLRRVTARLCGGQSPLELRHYPLIEELSGRPASAATVTLHLPQRLVALRSGEVLTLQRRGVLSVETSTASLGEREEVLLAVPGEVAVPGTIWLARVEAVGEEVQRELRTVLAQEDWHKVWRILPFSQYTVYIDREKIFGVVHDGEPESAAREDALVVRSRRDGDRIQPLGMDREKKVQDLLVDRHVPRAERGQIPLFFSREHCIWVGGVQLDHRVRLTRETRHILCLSIVHNTPGS